MSSVSSFGLEVLIMSRCTPRLAPFCPVEQKGRARHVLPNWAKGIRLVFHASNVHGTAAVCPVEQNPPLLESNVKELRWVGPSSPSSHVARSLKSGGPMRAPGQYEEHRRPREEGHRVEGEGPQRQGDRGRAPPFPRDGHLAPVPWRRGRSSAEGREDRLAVHRRLREPGWVPRGRNHGHHPPRER